MSLEGGLFALAIMDSLLLPWQLNYLISVLQFYSFFSELDIRVALHHHVMQSRESVCLLRTDAPQRSGLCEPRQAWQGRTPCLLPH